MYCLCLQQGILDKYNVELIGAKLPSIDKAEDRDLFKQVCPFQVLFASVCLEMHACMHLTPGTQVPPPPGTPQAACS